MSSKQRSCCCGGPSPQPCCAFQYANVLWNFGEAVVKIHFDGVAHSSSDVPTSGNYRRLVTSDGFTPPANGKFPSSATQGGAYTNALAAIAPEEINLLTDRILFPDCGAGRRPLHTYQFYLGPGSQFTQHLPWCGYWAATKTASLEMQDIFPPATASFETRGLYDVNVELDSETGEYFCRAYKVTSFFRRWCIEPWRYGTDPATPTRWETSVELEPATWINHAGVPYNFPSTDYLKTYSLVFSLVTDNTGNGCPFDMTYIREPNPSLTQYRGSTRIHYTANSSTIAYSTAANAPCLNRLVAPSSQNPVGYQQKVLPFTFLGGQYTPFFLSVNQPQYQCQVSIP